MEIKKGYKQTEIGVIPEDWEVKRLGEICFLVNEKTNLFNKKDYISTENMISYRGGIIEATGVPQGINVTHYSCGDVLISNIRPYLQKIWYATKNGGCSNDISVFRAFQNVNTNFLYHIISQDTFFEYANTNVTGTKMPRLNKKTILDFDLNLPTNLTEQTAIATVLSDMDEYILSLERLIAKKKDIKQGAMQNLLTGKIRLKGFKGEWMEKKLGEILQYEQPTNYIVQSTKYTNRGIPVLTAGKSLLLGYTVEKHGIYDNLPVIIFDDFTTDSKFVDYKFKVKSSAMKLLTSTGVCNIKLAFALMQMIDFPLKDHQRYWISEYSKIEVTIPKNKAEQTAIATILSDMDAEIEALQAKLQKAKLIKQGTMQELLTGKIRICRDVACHVSMKTLANNVGVAHDNRNTHGNRDVARHVSTGKNVRKNKSKL